jgi:hypothetical protein
MASPWILVVSEFVVLGAIGRAAIEGVARLRRRRD